jgi:hypothetical protein
MRLSCGHIETRLGPGLLLSHQCVSGRGCGRLSPLAVLSYFHKLSQNFLAMCTVRIFTVSDFRSGKKMPGPWIEHGTSRLLRSRRRRLLRGFSLLLSQLSYPGHRENGFEGVPLEIRNNQVLWNRVRIRLPHSPHLPNFSLV